MAHTPLPQNGPLAAILWRGFRGRCPRCGEGHIFRTFLKVNHSCSACGLELHHHRADDFPPYLVVAFVGHLMLSLVIYVEVTFAPPYWVHLALWIPLTLGLSVGLLQPVKGAVIALQWRMGMHGFGEAHSVDGAAPQA